ANPVGESELAKQLRRLRAQPPPVAADGVDLAVVGHKSERLSQRPAGLGIGRVTLVKNREPTLKRGIAQIGVELRELRRRQQALVHHRPRGERTEVGSLRNYRFSVLAKTKEEAFQICGF